MFWDRLLRKLIERRAAVIAFVVAMIIAGCYSYYTIPKQENPSTSVAAAFVTTVYPGASPEELDTFVTKKLEDKILALDKIDYVQSTSLNSAAVSVVMFETSVTLDETFSKLKEAVDSAQSSLPNMCQTSTVTPVMVDDTQFIISLSGEKYSSDDLVEYANTIKDYLIKIDGVTTIEIEGERTKQVTVETQLNEMSMYGVSIEDVLQLMQAQNISIPSGSINYDTGSIVVNTPSVFESLRDIENTVIGGSSTSVAFVKLKDVATVLIEDADSFKFRQNGKDSVLLVGYFQAGENAVNIGKRVRIELDSLEAQLPPDLVFHEVVFSPEDVNASITNFIINLAESVLLIVFVVMVGVQLRNGIIISISIPLSIFLTFIIMKLLNIEFQFISIAALIISLGILVDNAIVISEAIQQHINAGEEKTLAIIAAVKETYKSVLTSTLTTIATFSVLFFLPGAIGMVVSTIPIVVIASLTSSYFVAMFITPVMAYVFFKPESEAKQKKKSVINRFFIWLLNRGLRYKKSAVIIAFSTLTIAFFLVLQLGIKFFPTSTKPVLYINITGETSSFSQTDDIVKNIEIELEKFELIEHYATAVGTDLPSFFLTVPSRASTSNVAQIMLQINSDMLNSYGSLEIFASTLQQALDETVAGATISVKRLEYSMPTDAPITIYIKGSDGNVINAAAEKIAEQLRQIEGTQSVVDTAIVPEYEYVVDLDSAILSTYGLLKYDVVKQINTSLMGASSATYISGNSEMDIVVKSKIETLDDLYSLPITSSITGNAVELRQIAAVKLAAASPQVKRFNGDVFVSVLSNVKSGYSAVKIENELNKRLKAIDLGDVELESKGEFFNMMELIDNLYLSSSIAIFAIIMIMYFQFKDFKRPFIILASIPLSLIGCCLGLWMFKMDLQAMALLGAISLFGVVVNNGIVLMEFMDQKMAQGFSIHKACIDTVNMRCRAIMMTSITTCIGLVPLIIANDPMTAPMASVLLFGMLFSTVLTMVIVPVLYASMLEKQEKKEHKAIEKI